MKILLRKASLIMFLLVVTIFITGCNPKPIEEDPPIIIEDSTPYEEIYHNDILTAYEEGFNGTISKAMYGYTLKNVQGYNDWYYQYNNGNSFEDMTYNNDNERWESSTGYINGALQYSSDTEVAKTYLAEDAGFIIISGTVKVLETFTGFGNYKIKVNGQQIYPLNNESATIDGDDLIGYYTEVSVNVNSGDEIQFITEGDGELYWNPTIEYNALVESPLHFDLSYDSYTGEHIGDVHPYYYDGQLFMYYLATNGLYSSRLLTSSNFIQYEETEIFTHRVNPPATDSYYALGIVEQSDGLFRSFFGFSSTIINNSVSEDLITWSEGTGVDNTFTTTYLPKVNYPVGGRDPYAFYDPDIDRYRVIYLGYYENKFWDNGGSGFDSALSITTSTTNTMEYWEEEQFEILRFDNAGISERDEVEVSQMFKIGDRWYVFGSIYGRSDNGVGRTSYWKGEANTKIEDEDWNQKPEQFLTGNDLCAGQIVQVGNRYYIYGWIPYVSTGGRWGGTLNIAREVYQLTNGDLGTRLDPYITNLLNRGKEYSLGDGTDTEISGEWNVSNHGASIISEGNLSLQAGSGQFSQLLLDGIYDRNLLTFNLSIEGGSNQAGVLLENTGDGKKYYVYVDASASKLYIKTKESSGFVTKAELELQSIDYIDMEIKIIIEGSIVEVFINDQYSLVSKISNFNQGELHDYTISLFADGENAIFEDVIVNKLSSMENIYD